AAAAPHATTITTTAEVRDLYARLLNRDDVTDESTFVSLDGDSLSYVEMSIQLEDALGTLPANWHTTPIRALTPGPQRRRAGWKHVETNVLIRAAAIVAIVGTHANLFTILGGAHALLGIAGYNFARFHLTAAGRRERIGHVVTSVARVALPSMIWIAGAAALSESYTLTNALLLNGLLGPDRWSSQWHYWFIEVIVYTLLALALMMAVPWVDRLERRSPFWFSVGLTGVGLLTRYEIVGFGNGPRLGVAHIIFWLFAIGWAAAKAPSGWHRMLVSALIALTIPGFFDNPARDAVVIGALLFLVWIPSIPVPTILARLSGVVASSSLYIYLTHWQVYPYLDDYSPLLAVVASIVVGIAYWKVASYVMGGRARYGRR
ncbi:MAG: acyltransferase family protein, partial [Jiangellaceae bacterium]